MEQNLCQSCGMPIDSIELQGSNADQSKNKEYCRYCYANGCYTAEYTMDQMIDHCAQFVDEFNKNAGLQYNKEEAIARMKAFFPHLKRWKQA